MALRILLTTVFRHPVIITGPVYIIDLSFFVQVHRQRDGMGWYMRSSRKIMTCGGEGEDIWHICLYTSGLLFCAGPFVCSHCKIMT